MGGQTKSEFDDKATKTNDVWYSEDGVQWTQATASAAWTKRYKHTSVVFKNKMWVIGGNYLNDVWYSSDGISWTEATASAPWVGRSRHTSVVHDNKIWVIGGSDNNIFPLGDVWYSEDGVQWTQATATQQWVKRMRHSSLVHMNRMWVFGGRVSYNISDVQSDVWCTNASTSIENEMIGETLHHLSINKIYPHLSKNKVTMRYTLSTEMMTEVAIFTIDGSRVKDLWSGDQPAGAHTITWDGKDDTGKLLPSSMYLVRIGTDKGVFTETFVK